MRKPASLAAVLALGASIAACDGFLTGPGLTENPNNPVEVTPTQLFIAAQASQFVQEEAQLARLTSMYVQQLAGTNNQQLNWGSQYLFTEADVTGYFNAVYVGGGLQDLRRVQAAADSIGDNQFEGIAKIWEAIVIGRATALWGDIPYREAVTPGIDRPALDPQQQVYSDLQTLLDEAITLLGGPGPGPGNADLVFFNGLAPAQQAQQVARWRKVAYTLKARYHLHTAERLGAAAYTAARAAAQQGIDEAPTSVAAATHGQGPGDLRALHGNDLATGNIWAQFLGARQDIVAGRVLIQILQSRPGDPRLDGYFDPAVAPATFRGANGFGVLVDGSPASQVDVPTRRQFNFRQPIVTWAENQLILAETNFRLGAPGTALTHLNNVRAALGLAPLGAVTLEDILQEKYIVQFQNIDAYSDYRRTCYPILTPGGQPPATQVPARVPYGSLERLNNPNIPVPGAAPATNWNDPNPCTGVVV